MKTKCTFGFIDQPQYRTVESREYCAHLLKSYRKQPRYIVTRIGAGLYRLRSVAFNSAIATLTTR